MKKIAMFLLAMQLVVMAGCCCPCAKKHTESTQQAEQTAPTEQPPAEQKPAE